MSSRNLLPGGRYVILSLVLALLTAGACADVRPRLILYARANAFVTRDGTLDQNLSPPYELKIEESAGQMLLSGFGMEAEPVRAYLTSPFARWRTLVFVGEDGRSERRPTLVYHRAGFATLYTRRLRLGGLRLRAIAEVSRPFLRDTIDTNALGLAIRGRWRVRCDEVLATLSGPPLKRLPTPVR